MADSLLKTIKLGDADVTRLVIGGNPFSGNSHVNSVLDAEMEDYFTTQTIKDTLLACLNNGINTAQMRADKHIMRILREFRLEGHDIQWIVMTASEVSSFDGNVNLIMSYNPTAIYLHGSITDGLYKDGNIAEIKRRLGVLRRTGKPAGLGSHMPELLLRAEEENWGADWYMCCVYNLSRADRVSSAITGKANSDEPFFDEDIPVMYKTIRELPKPCMAFKILGATRRSGSREDVESAFKEAYANIKPTDGVIVGMFPKYSDQVKENCGIVREILG
ncbi:MAG: hypothetical protein FWF44_05590 [Defluviitaleaceae bacterium]|nr:hypothetical protein [Defluviitaleaceae bacterium]